MDTIQKNFAESGNRNSNEKVPQPNVVLSLSLSQAGWCPIYTFLFSCPKSHRCTWL